MKKLLHWLLELRSRISTYFYSAVGLAALSTLMMIVVASQSFDRISLSQQQISSNSLPAMVSVIRIAKLSSDLVAATPKLVAANSTLEVNTLSEETQKLRAELEQQLSFLRSFEQAIAATEFSQLAFQLNALVQNVETSMLNLFDLRSQLARHREKLSIIETQIRRTIIPLTDDQFFYLVTGRTELGQAPDPADVHFTVNEVNQYRNISVLEQQSNNALQYLASAGVVTDRALLKVRSELFDSTVATMRRNIERIDDQRIKDQIIPSIESLILLGAGESNGFILKEQELKLLDDLFEFVADSRILSSRLASDAEKLVTAVRDQASLDAEETFDVIATSRTLIISIGIAGVIGAVTIVWLLIGRSLLPRLRYLSERMRSMGEGELDDPVEMVGKDEITDMASALEIFRKSALDARRLNIVEQLSKDLLVKNREMQVVLDKLKSAQSQIVMREKLAALGELTAGVAHEIKNPLNFVTNFSDSSKELIEELGEIMADSEMDEKEREEEIESICKMLSDNVMRIREHGGRAVRIVNDMLRMGRGGGHAQETNINQLVEQHAKLAFHGARASTEGFQIKLEFDLKDDVGEIEVVSQDIGRVILNIVGNSCYATHKKRLKFQEEAEDGVPIEYIPFLKVSTEKQDDLVLVTIRDNGSGIPDDLREKIFNPFFTTKPTDEGTGLGLALCNDIVQKHGGKITVDSSEGEYTQMTISIPENAGKILAESDDSGEDDEAAEAA